MDAGFVAPSCDVEIKSEHPSTTEGGRIFIEVVAERSDAELTFDVPADWRFVGDRLEPPYGTSGTFDVKVTATCNDASGEDTLSVEVTRISWQELTPWTAGVDGPLEREHPMLFVDAGDPDRLLMFGGFLFQPQQYTITNDLWAYDLANETWTELNSNGAPMLASGRIAPVPNERAAIYHGGNDQQNRLPFSLVRVDYDAEPTWTEITPNGAPNDGVILGSFVLDEARNRMLSLCGFGASGIHCNVEAFDLTTEAWALLQPAGDAPSGRYGFFVANDPENERVIVFSGGQQSFNGTVNPAQDTWALELAESPVRWVQIEGDGPPGRRNGCSAVDPIGHRFFVFGGTPDARTTEQGLWVLDLDRGEESWTLIEPDGSAPARSSCAAVYDPARRRILFGFGNNSAAIYADWQALQL